MGDEGAECRGDPQPAGPGLPRLIATRDAALAAGAPPEKALGAAQELAAEILSPALPAYALRETALMLGATGTEAP